MTGALKEFRYYTYSDYLTWPDDIRYEIIDGTPYLMASPSEAHQAILFELAGQIWNFLKGKPCKAFTAPFDVRLNPKSGDDTVVQPDLLVVCDGSKLDGKACVGAPDLIVEILSPSTALMDRFIKFNRYLYAGVMEYWIIDPETRMAAIHFLKDGQYVVNTYGDTNTVSVNVLPGCEISLSDVFGEPDMGARASLEARASSPAYKE